MPAIARVVGKDKSGGQVEITVRVTGLGDVYNGTLPKRAKLRALIASGFVPDTLTGERVTNEVRQSFVGEYTKDVSEEFNMSLDEQLVEEAPAEDVKNALDVITEFGVFAQLDSVTKLNTKGIMGVTPIKNRFGKGFVDIVNTGEYTFIITTKYSF